jgi:hypothetical protein
VAGGGGAVDGDAVGGHGIRIREGGARNRGVLDGSAL